MGKEENTEAEAQRSLIMPTPHHHHHNNKPTLHVLRRSLIRRPRNNNKIIMMLNSSSSSTASVMKEEASTVAEKREEEEEEEEEEKTEETGEREEVERKINALKRIVPGGESLGVDNLFDETATYILSLQCQVKALRALTGFFEKLEKETTKFGA